MRWRQRHGQGKSDDKDSTSDGAVSSDDQYEYIATASTNMLRKQ